MDEKQIQLSFLDDEIAKELESNPNPNSEITAENAAVVLPDKINNVSRKPFVMHDFDTPRDKEMAVFTHAKKLSEYIFVITEKSPKKLRWSIVSRLQNISTELIENLYRANYEREATQRAEFQKRALVCIDLLDFYAETAKRMQAINLHQMSVIAKQTSDVNKLLKGWIKSAKRV
ncbi:MAG: four helix bundle protein [Bacteroides sp.]|nr:four helix bundle protein [[Eubacterium] siraeum]MCM1455926.1 four helix bundle protein [Bacteroides sp.]